MGPAGGSAGIQKLHRLITCNSIERTGSFGFFDSDFENVAVRAYCLCPGNRVVIDGGHVSSKMLVSEEG